MCVCVWVCVCFVKNLASQTFFFQVLLLLSHFAGYGNTGADASGTGVRLHTAMVENELRAFSDGWFLGVLLVVLLSTIPDVSASPEMHCNVAVDLHSSFVSYWGGGLACSNVACQQMQEERAKLKAYNMMQEVFYKFENEEGFRYMKLVLDSVSMACALYINTSTRGNADKIMNDYSTYLDLSNSSAPRHFSKVCLNVLFLHLEMGKCCSVGPSGAFLTPCLGIATKSSYNTDSNRILITSLTILERTPPLTVQDWQVPLVIAHEMGHFMGADHDDIYGSECRAPVSLKNSFTDEYIMYALVSNDEFGIVSDKWSNCSKTDILSDMTNRAPVSVRPHINVCANKSNVSLSCCANGNLLPAGHSCRPSQADVFDFPCHLASTCDGIHAECRSAATQPDGSICIHAHSEPGFCMFGRCVHVHDPLCTPFSINGQRGKGCSIKGFECILACDFADGNGCTAASAFASAFGFSKDCPNFLANRANQNFYNFDLISYPPLVQNTTPGVCIRNYLYGPENMPCMQNGLLGLCSSNGLCSLSSSTSTMHDNTTSTDFGHCQLSLYGYSLFRRPAASTCNNSTSATVPLLPSLSNRTLPSRLDSLLFPLSTCAMADPTTSIPTLSPNSSSDSAAASNTSLIAGCVTGAVVVLLLVVVFFLVKIRRKNAIAHLRQTWGPPSQV